MRRNSTKPGFFKTKLDGFAYARHQLIKRLGLGVTTVQCWNRGYKVTRRIFFNNHIKLVRHVNLHGNGKIVPRRARGKVQDSRFKGQGAKQMQDTRFKMQGKPGARGVGQSRCKIQDSRSKVQDPRFKIQGRHPLVPCILCLASCGVQGSRGKADARCKIQGSRGEVQGSRGVISRCKIQGRHPLASCILCLASCGVTLFLLGRCGLGCGACARFLLLPESSDGLFRGLCSQFPFLYISVFELRLLTLLHN